MTDKPDTQERIAKALERLVKIEENKADRKDRERGPAFWRGDTFGEAYWPGK
jgi:hypothetical protein